MPSHSFAVHCGLIATDANSGAGIIRTSEPSIRPARLTWGDFTPELRAAFRAAAEKLERLIYVLYGSRVASYSPYTPWWHRLNPRCLWPEQFVEQPPEFPSCRNWTPSYRQTAALGEAMSGQLKPRVPLRSRSGDWRIPAYVTGSHDREIFPVESVGRADGSQLTYDMDPTFDPLGTGNFGGDPARIGTDGPWHIDGEAVDVWYSPPAALRPHITAVTLSHRAAGGSWSVVPMVSTGGDYTASIPPRAHNTRVQWYISVTHTRNGTPVTVRDPLTAPDVPYEYVAFTHWNPYPLGFPEMWALCRKGTDRYEFDGTETVQPELLNLMRWVLDFIGDEWAHSPHQHPGTCCIYAPIRWRWLGSGPWPQPLLSRSDGSNSTAYYLHNMHKPAPTHPGVNTSGWRGAGRWYPWNPYFGQGASWESPPRLVTSEAVGSGCDNPYLGTTAGLLEDDMISASHLWQIVAAVEYLCNAGLWTQVPIRRIKRTPPLAWDLPGGYTLGCGDILDYRSDWDPQYTLIRARQNSWMPATWCCASISWDSGRGEWVCTPYAAPTTWEDCMNSPHGGVCYTYQSHLCEGSYANLKYPFEYQRHTTICTWSTSCGDFAFNDCIRYPFGPGTDGCIIGCVSTQGVQYESQEWEGEYEPDPEDYPSCDSLTQFAGRASSRTSDSRACAYSAYICGPRRNMYGVDEYHGNGHGKVRCSVQQACGIVLPSAGNRFAEFFVCAPRPASVAPETVTAVDVAPYQPEWPGNHCGMNIGGTDYYALGIDDVPDDTSLNHYHPVTGVRTCEEYRHTSIGPTNFSRWYWRFWCERGNSNLVGCHEHAVGCDSVAQGWAWARVDLNLQNGYPTLYQYAAEHDDAYTDDECTLCPSLTEPE